MVKTKKSIFAAVVFVAVAAVAVVVVCSATGVFDKNDHRTWYEEAKDGGISDEMAEKITVGMNFSDVVDIIGTPQRDTGSGVWIMEWDMKSGKVLAVCFNRVPYDESTDSSNTDCEKTDLVSCNVQIRDQK